MEFAGGAIRLTSWSTHCPRRPMRDHPSSNCATLPATDHTGHGSSGHGLPGHGLPGHGSHGQTRIRPYAQAEAAMRITMRRVLFLVPVFAATLTLSAQAPRLLDKDTFMEMEAVANPAISPDGSRVVFAREWIDQMKDQRRSNLWVARTDGSRVRELTTGAWRDSAPVWAPDGTRIAFLSDRDGTTQLQ